MANIFEELTSLRPKELKTNSQFALDWYRNNIRRIFDRRKNENIYLDGVKTGKLEEGNMYMMFYNAKTKDKLPYSEQPEFRGKRTSFSRDDEAGERSQAALSIVDALVGKMSLRWSQEEPKGNS